MRAQIVLFDGFDPLDVIAPFEVLAAGAMVADGAMGDSGVARRPGAARVGVSPRNPGVTGSPAMEVELVSAEGAREVPSGMGLLSLRATARLEPSRADLVVVPGAAGRIPDGGEAREDSIPVILGRTLDTDLPALLKEALDRPGLTVATVCGGSLVLGLAGLIEGRPATTHHLGLDALAATGTVAIDARVVDDSDLVTAAGVTSGLDLGLYLLERELGPQIAHAVEKLFAHERRGTVWRNVGFAPAIAL